LNFTADPGATSDSLAIACPPPEASCVALSDALLDELLLASLLLDAALLEALLEALPDALPDALPLFPVPDPPPQAESTDAPATLTPIAPPRRMNRSREIFSFKTSPRSLVFHLSCGHVTRRFIREPQGCGCAILSYRPCVYVE